MSEQQVKTLYATVLRSELEELRARASLPVGVPGLRLPERKRTEHLAKDAKTMTPVRAAIEAYNRALDEVAALNAPAAQLADEPDCDRSACGDFSPGPCDNPDCTARRDKPAAEQSAPGEVDDSVRESFDKWFRSEQLIADHIDTTFISEAFLPYRAWKACAAQLAARDAGDVQVPVELVERCAAVLNGRLKNELRALLAQREREGE